MTSEPAPDAVESPGFFRRNRVTRDNPHHLEDSQ
jgi:hypothetical protein